MDTQPKTTATATPHHHKGKKGKRKAGGGGGGDESLKVVYISSPMKVRTSVARFRSLVQQLTGKNSDIAPYLDSDEGALVGFRDENGLLLPDVRPDSSASVSCSDDATSESFLSAAELDNVSRMGGDLQFGGGFFSPETFSGDPGLDVLGSYEDLIM